MRRFRKCYLILSWIIVISFTTLSFAAHMYYIGVISQVDNSQMTLDGKEYQMSPGVKVILRVVGSNGSIHEKNGQISDIRSGNKVAIKVSNGQIVEVEKVVR